MTNAQKFKEVFGFDNSFVSSYWNAEYQGTPTIPLSVIEKIHDAIDNAESDGFLINENGHMLAMTLTKEHVNEIIDKAVKECTHETN